MFKRISLACAGAVLALSFFACAAAPTAAPPNLSGKPSTAEAPFVTSVQTDLMRRFASATDAEQAGYFRYNNEDTTGSISYVNLQWWNSDPRHPSQLWYDVKGNLLGADFTVLVAGHSRAPHLWSVNPARWSEFKHPHLHYILKNADGTFIYGRDAEKALYAEGDDVANHPTAALIAKLHKATIFTYPAIWDLQVWLKPNPNGAFSQTNPNVTPSKNAGADGM
jgi:hypothetical protein